jgi:tetratricopeptide (TPR) repeat protein
MSEGRLRELFEQAAELAPQERERFVQQSCGHDTTMSRELRELLAADSAAIDDGFWNYSAFHHEVVEESAANSAIGEIIGHYRLVEVIGKGGMGSVYRGERTDDAFEKSVAVKLIDSGFYSPDLIAHFRSERQILANLEHPNIARLLDGGARPDGAPYLIMEFVEGISPYDYCNRHYLNIPQRLQIFRQVCSAVHYAHQNMVIHRDLKPGNILVTADGTPKLLDFGIAKVLKPSPSAKGEALTQPGMLKMTARYASPEQIRGESVTSASDVYSLGVILYELLTGHSAYGDPDRPAHQIMTAVCDEEPPRPSTSSPKLRGDLDRIILRALKKLPGERYASVDQFSEDIQRHLEGLPVLARGDAPLYLAAKFIRRYRVIVAAAALVLCSLIVGLVEVTLARARADRRFNEVRQLAHSVMFDYADAIDRLPGSTPVRARLVKDALTYLDSLSKEADTPELKREIVDAYVRVSDVQGNEYENNLGDPAAALASAGKAVTTAEELLRKDRTPPSLTSAAQAFSSYGDMLFSTGDLSATDRAYQRAIGIRQEVASKSPEDLTNNIALSQLYRRMADLDGGFGWPNLGKTQDALTYDQQAKALVDRLNVQFPGNKDVVGESTETLVSLSTAEAIVGRRADAANHLAAAIEQIETVGTAHPGDQYEMFELAVSEMRYQQFPIENTSPLPHLMRAAALLHQMLDANPQNALYRRRQTVLEVEWGAALRAEGQVKAGLGHNQRALSLAQSLSHDAPGSAQYRTDVGYVERELSTGLLANGDSTAALKHADQAQQILCSNKQEQQDPYTLSNCGRSLLAAANAYFASHQLNAAIPACRAAESIAATLSQADPANAIFRSDWAHAQASLAKALAASGDDHAARTLYEGALNRWSILRQSRALSPEDAHRADEAALALAALHR